MRRILAIVNLLFVYSVVVQGASGAHAVITSNPNRGFVFEDEPVLFDGSSSWSDEGTIIAYSWTVDGGYGGSDPTCSAVFTLAPGQTSKTVSISLWVMDDWDETALRTISVLVKRRPQSYYYLTDHLGSIRATVKGGEVMVEEDFSGGLSQWTVTSGGPFVIEDGELSCSAGGTNILVNSSTRTFGDGILTVDGKLAGTGDNRSAYVIVRYQDANNFYLVVPTGATVKIYERLGGTYYSRQSGNLSEAIAPNAMHRMQIVAEGGKLSVFWDYATTPVVEWTDTVAAWLSGKVGFYSGGHHFHWDNLTVTTGSPGLVVSADDYDAWGLVLEGRSFVQGSPDTRYKFTGKERDQESLYDYFGARYYDARIGRFLQIDPKAHSFLDYSPYNYAIGNPLKYVDPDGEEVRAYSEALSSATMWRGGGIAGLLAAALVEPRHSYIRVTTDKIDVILELGGPRLDPNKGEPNAQDAKYETGQRPDQQEHKVDRPEGIGEKDFSFENKIIGVFNAIEQNLPDYNGKDGPNSNGFVTFLIEAAGGKVALPERAIGKNEIAAYWKNYLEYLKQQEEKKKEEEKNSEDQNK